MPAGQQPICNHKGGQRRLLPVHEDNRKGAHAEQAVGTGKASEELRASVGSGMPFYDCFSNLLYSAEVHISFGIPPIWRLWVLFRM
jgi:hypothetical protein